MEQRNVDRKDLQLFMRAIFFALMLWIGVCIHIANAQPGNINVTGTVQDVNGEPLIGVTVLVANTENATITDIDGNYSLSKLKSSSVIHFSYIGMKTQSVIVGNRKKIDVVMEDDTNQLEEVVVIGYGTSTKRDLTGAMSSVKTDIAANQAISTAEQALVGRVAGVRVTPDFSPGGSVSIQIRGANSMMGGVEPLYVVDGFPIEPIQDAKGNKSGDGESQSSSSLNFINPDDIESMEVLKDASATAIYGARGANGVVLITTKSAKSGKSTVSYDMRATVSSVGRYLDMMNSEEFANMINQKELNRYYLDVTKPGYTNVIPINLPYDGVQRPLPKDLPTTDWQKAMFRTTLSTNHTIRVQGTSKSTKYTLSLGYTGQDGIMICTDFNRFSINSNVEQQIFKNLTVRNNLNASKTDSNGGWVNSNDAWNNRSLVTAALFMQPFYGLDIQEREDFTDEDISNDGLVQNPYREAKQMKDKKTNYVVTDAVTANWTIYKDLIFTGKGGVHYVSSDRYQYWPRTLQRGRTNNGIASIANNSSLKLLSEAYLNYSKTFNKNHKLSAMGGVTYENSHSVSKFNEYRNFPDDELGYYGITSATEHIPTAISWSDYTLFSGIARLNYTLKGRYLLTTTFRADGSTRFSQNKKWGFFPSVAFAWRISDEKWMKPLEFINDLKLRASWGLTGSEGGIQPYRSLGILTVKNGIFGDQIHSGKWESNLANPNLSWETTEQYNVGLDTKMFNGRLSLTLDFYYKKTYDLLQNVTLPTSFGYTSKIMNFGQVENKGFEFDLTGVCLRRKDFYWDINVNGAINRNKLVALNSNTDHITGPRIGAMTSVNRFIVGQPMGVFWGYKVEGVFADWKECEESHIYKATPGEFRFSNRFIDYQKHPDGTFKLDNDGNKIPEEVQNINDDDKTIIGNPNPDLTFGFGSSFRWKKLNLNVLFTGQLGGDIFWYDYAMMVQQTRTFNCLKSVNKHAWTAPLEYTFNVDGNEYTVGSKYGNVYGASGVSSRQVNGAIGGIDGGSYRNEQINSSLIFDASYLKLANIQVGYTFNLKKVLKSIRVGFAVNNVFTITKYPGYDPEAASFVKNPMMRGIDFGSYPSQRTYVFSAGFVF